MCHQSKALSNLIVRVISAAALALGGCAGSTTESHEPVGSEQGALVELCPDSVPANLTPRSDQQLFLVLRGDGVQIYECRAAGNGFAWTFVAPEAVLLSSAGEVAGRHFAGPTWQSEDGSSVKAAKVAEASAPIPGAVPWLLLTAVDHGGNGVMSRVTTIQRLDTTGGVAPASGCDAGHVGAIARVPYTAGYFFYGTSNSRDNPQCGG